LDAVLGLIPGVGDSAGAVISGYILVVAARYGVPASMLGRMLANVAVEALVGTVPALGDLFDTVWKANVRNLALLEGYLEDPEEGRHANRLVVWGILLVLVGVTGTAAWASWRVLMWALGLF